MLLPQVDLNHRRQPPRDPTLPSDDYDKIDVGDNPKKTASNKVDSHLSVISPEKTASSKVDSNLAVIRRSEQGRSGLGCGPCTGARSSVHGGRGAGEGSCAEPDPTGRALPVVRQAVVRVQALPERQECAESSAARQDLHTLRTRARDGQGLCNLSFLQASAFSLACLFVSCCSTFTDLICC